MTINAITDAVLAISEDTQLYDIRIDSQGDILTDDFFDTSILYSLFGERRANKNEVVDARFRRGWIGNEDKDFENGSKLWLFEQSKITATNLARIADEAKKSLRWLVDDGHAVSLSVDSVTVDTDKNKLVLVLDIRRSADKVERRFFDLWDNTGIRTDTIPPPEPFSPNEINDLILYLDSSDLNSVIFPDGFVSLFKDKSGEENDAIQNVFVNQPISAFNFINGVNAIVWRDGEPHILEVAANPTLNQFWSNGGTVIMVSQSTSLGNNDVGRFLDKEQTWRINKMDVGAENVQFNIRFTGSIARFKTPDNSFPFGPSIITLSYSAVLTSNLPVFRINGADQLVTIVVPASGVYSPDTLTLGIGNRSNGEDRSFEGDFGQILLYDRILTDNETNKIEDHLSNKWGIALV